MVNEYEVGYDQFHQSESMIYFYLLCMADPTHELNQERARRFAGFFLNEGVPRDNYDFEHKILKSAHNGSLGARPAHTAGPYGGPGFTDGSMARYGLPFEDVVGVDGKTISTVEDLEDPENALAMGEAMHRRMEWGDSATNLHVCTMMQNAFIMSGDAKYKTWLLDYVGAWMERAEAHDGLLPDNIGLGGIVGEEMDGRWYGANYGWSWPHGFYNIAMASLLAGVSCFQLTGDRKFLDLPRKQIDTVMGLGKVEALDISQMSLAEHWTPQMSAIAGRTIADDEASTDTNTGGSTLATRDRKLAGAGDALITPTFVVPYRYLDSGWFDYQPMAPMYPAMLWNVCGDEADMQTLETIREKEPFDWRGVYSFRTKEDAGHEPPWLCYLQGENP